MRTIKKSSRIKAAVMSLVMAAAMVPASTAAPASAVSLSGNISISTPKNAVASLAEDDKAVLYTADYITSDAKNICISFVAPYTGNFVYGFGIGTAADPYWYELNDNTDWVDGSTEPSNEIAITEGETVNLIIDVSDLTLSYTPSSSQYPGKFEFRNYYSNGNTIEVTSVKANVDESELPTDPSTDPTEPTDPDTPDTPENNVPSNNPKSGDWSVVDNGDGTATITATLSKQIDGLDYLLTAGYDEDYYILNPDEMTEDGSHPINSHKFKYSEFGLTDTEGVTIQSITATVETDVDAKLFMYGGGLNVKSGSPADTEYAKMLAGIEGKENAGYWYNDMGEDEIAEFEDAGVEFQVTPGTGATMNDAGTYIEAYWEVPAEVQPYATFTADSAVSFQFWYGEEATEDESYVTLDTCTLTSIALTYTKEVTVPYTGSIATAVEDAMLELSDDAAAELNVLKVDYASLGIEENMDVYAVRFDVSASADIGKLVYGIGTSTTDETAEYWFQDSDYVLLEAGQTDEIMWIVPSELTGGLENLVDDQGQILLGYWYGETDSITVENIEVYYAEAPETTTTTTATTTTATTTTTTTTTTTEPELEVSLWGDANVDGVVDINDAVLVMSYMANKSGYPISEQGMLNADVYQNGDGLSIGDSSAIQKYLAKKIQALPES